MGTRRRKESPADKSSRTTITDLHISVLHHILSFLPTPAAIQTSAVTPPWRNLWRLLPTLEFDMHDFQQRNRGYTNRECRLLFSEFVNQALRRRPREFPIQKFKLYFFYRNYDHIRAYVDAWVRMLVELRAVELDFDFGYSGFRFGSSEKDDGEGDDEILKLYEFHLSKIVSSSVEFLKLRDCSLIFPGKELCMNLFSIKEVHLGYSCCCDADEIEQLMVSCVNLETFEFVFREYSRDLNIVSGNLRHLTILSHTFKIYKSSLKVCTPRLESIVLDGNCSWMYALKDVSTSSLVKATIDSFVNSLWEYACWTNVLSSLIDIKHLTIINNFMDFSYPKTCEDVIKMIEEQGFENPEYIAAKFKFEEKVFSETFAFRNLNFLTIQTGYLKYDILGLDVLFKKCPQLETMVLDGSNYSNQDEDLEKEEIPDNLVALQIPRLKVVKMEGFLCTKNELYFAGLLKKHGVVLEKIIAFPAEVDQVTPPPFVL